MATRNGWICHDFESASHRYGNRLPEFLLADMALGLRYQEQGPPLHRPAYFGKQPLPVRHLVDHGKNKGKVHTAFEVFYPKGFVSADSRIYVVRQPGPLGPSLQGRYHLLLKVDTDDLAHLPDKPC